MWNSRQQLASPAGSGTPRQCTGTQSVLPLLLSPPFRSINLSAPFSAAGLPGGVLHAASHLILEAGHSPLWPHLPPSTPFTGLASGGSDG